jgi:hypothetical protein
VNKIVDFLSKYGMLVALAAQALPMFTGGLKFAKAGLDKLGSMREMSKLKSEVPTPGTSMSAPGGKGGGGMLGKLGGIAKLAGGVMAVANIATTAFGAFETQQQQQAEYEKAKASGDKKAMAEARANQGEAIGGAAGSLAGGALGMALGGPIGAAVGSYLGEMAGGALGKYIGPYWDGMTAKAEAMWTSTKQALSGAWDTTSKFLSSSASKFGDAISNKAKDVGAALGDLVVFLGKGLMTLGSKLMEFFGTIGSVLWSGIKKTPVFQIGSYIWDSIAKTDIGGKLIKVFKGVTETFSNMINGIFEWAKGALTNLLPDWAKKLLSKVSGDDTTGYTEERSKEKASQPKAEERSKEKASQPKTESKPDAKTDAKPSAPATPTQGPNGEKLVKMPDGRLGYGSTDTGKFYPLTGNKMGAAEDYKAAYNKTAPKNPTPTTNAANQGQNNASKQGEGRKDQNSDPPLSSEKKVSTAPPEVSKPGGAVTEKDMPRLLADTLKLAEYTAKQNARMLDVLAAVSENTKRNAAASEKIARNT